MSQKLDLSHTQAHVRLESKNFLVSSLADKICHKGIRLTRIQKHLTQHLFLANIIGLDGMDAPLSPRYTERDASSSLLALASFLSAAVNARTVFPYEEEGFNAASRWAAGGNTAMSRSHLLMGW